MRQAIRTRRHRSRPARGLGLVEILVAISLGLFLVASVAALVVGQIDEQRRLLLESRLTQDLRAVTDLIARDLRRAGHWGGAERGVWAGGAASAAPNPYLGLHPGESVSAGSVGYAYSRDAVEDGLVSNAERVAFRINPNTQAFEMRVSGLAIAPGNGDQWQALTDPSLLRVTRWQVRHETSETSLLGHCAQATCPTGSTTCPPVWRRHRMHIEIEAADAKDTRVRRSLATQVGVRNGEVRGACPDA